MRRIIVDCTHTHHTGASTGIQRVVRQFADALLAVGPERGLEVVPVRLEAGHCVPLPIDGGRVAFPRSASAREAVSAGSAAVTPSRGIPPPGATAFRDGDLFLSLDSSWVYDIRSALDEAGKRGVTRCAVVCDALPLTNPEWFTEGTIRLFGEWLAMLLPRLEGVVGISQATCDAIEGLVTQGKLRVGKMPPARAVHLGAEISGAADAVPRGDWPHRFGAGSAPAFLSVGTIEPRKNHAFALDLYDELNAKGFDFQWHFVGAPGWLAEDVVNRIRRHRDFGTRLFWWTDLSDGELTWLYQHARALVVVSIAEGFGLPLVEARLQGLPVFASNIPVFREVLEKEARYLPLSSEKLAAAALGDFLAAGAVKPTQPTQVARSWEASAEELLQAVLAFDAKRP